MNKIQQRRLYLLMLMAIGLGIAASLILYALKQNINAFLTPSQLASTTSDYGTFRLGGMVKPGSIVHDRSGLGVEFVVTDYQHELRVHYVGVLPDLFREGKGAIALGRLSQPGLFIATQVLAKHDENYMPKKRYRISENYPGT